MGHLGQMCIINDYIESTGRPKGFMTELLLFLEHKYSPQIYKTRIIKEWGVEFIYYLKDIFMV